MAKPRKPSKPRRRTKNSGITPSPNDDTARYRREHSLRVAKGQGRPIIQMNPAQGGSARYARITGSGLPGLKGK